MKTMARRASITLPSDEQILISREFDAPRALVYRAWTEPELVRRWWAGQRGDVVSIEIDLRVGGAWRYVMTATAGFEVAFHGEYREIVPEQRIASTEVFEGAPDAPAVNVITFSERDGGTLVEILVTHLSRENRDAHIQSGMEGGLQEAMDLLESTARDLAGPR